MKNAMTIVVGTDFSPLARIACDTASRLAQRMNAKVHLVHILDEFLSYTQPFPLSPELESLRKRRVEEHLAEVDHEGIELTYEARSGVPARDLVKVAEERRADLIIIATHGYGPIRRALLGSVAASVIRCSPIPVLVVGRERAGDDFSHVIAAVDLSPVSERVVELARRFSTDTVTVVNTYNVPPTLAYAELPARVAPEEVSKIKRARLQRLVEIAGDNTELLEGPASMTILEKAEREGASLIVVGTSGHNAWERAFLGSTATRILASASCPVLVVPSEPA